MQGNSSTVLYERSCAQAMVYYVAQVRLIKRRKTAKKADKQPSIR